MLLRASRRSSSRARAAACSISWRRTSSGSSWVSSRPAGRAGRPLRAGPTRWRSWKRHGRSQLAEDRPGQVRTEQGDVETARHLVGTVDGQAQSLELGPRQRGPAFGLGAAGEATAGQHGPSGAGPGLGRPSVPGWPGRRGRAGQDRSCSGLRRHRSETCIRYWSLTKGSGCSEISARLASAARPGPRGCAGRRRRRGARGGNRGKAWPRRRLRGGAAGRFCARSAGSAPEGRATTEISASKRRSQS